MAKIDNDAAKQNAVMAVRRWLALQDDTRNAELNAMGVIATLPGKSIVVKGRRYVAVTSRRCVDIRPARRGRVKHG